MNDDDLDDLLEEFHERSAIHEAAGATRSTADRRAWARLVEREGPVTMRLVRERAFEVA